MGDSIESFIIDDDPFEILSELFNEIESDDVDDDDCRLRSTSNIVGLFEADNDDDGDVEYDNGIGVETYLSMIQKKV